MLPRLAPSTLYSEASLKLAVLLFCTTIRGMNYLPCLTRKHFMMMSKCRAKTHVSFPKKKGYPEVFITGSLWPSQQLTGTSGEGL